MKSRKQPTILHVCSGDNLTIHVCAVLVFYHASSLLWFQCFCHACVVKIADSNPTLEKIDPLIIYGNIALERGKNLTCYLAGNSKPQTYIKGTPRPGTATTTRSPLRHDRPETQSRIEHDGSRSPPKQNGMRIEFWHEKREGGINWALINAIFWPTLAVILGVVGTFFSCIYLASDRERGRQRYDYWTKEKGGK